MLVLGLNCCFAELEEDFIPDLPRWFYHDAAACLVRDGEVLAAVEEERLNRIKHTNKFSGLSARACLDHVGLSPEEVDRIAFFFAEDYTDNELSLQYVEHPSVPLAYARPLIVEGLARQLGTAFPADRVVFVRHHLAHAYAAYYHSGFDDALVVVVDGNGEEESISIFDVRGGAFELLETFPPERSMGHLYSTATELLGYTLFDEYKVMGLAPHGDPARYRPLFRSLYELRPDGEYELELDRLKSCFLRNGFKPRRKGEPFSREHSDLAAALQETLETIVAHVLAHWRAQTGRTRLCLAGGVAHNSALNGRLLSSRSFDRVFVHPAAHDAGASVGAALYVCRHEAPESFSPRALRDVYWGPELGARDEVRKLLEGWEALVSVEEPADVCDATARLLADGAVVGWVQGRSEFGPRALGNRSILADARPAENRERINELVKKREAFRPFAPSVPAEAARDFFDVPDAAPPLDFMVFVVDVLPEKRELLGAVTHVDGTARIQTVARETNERYWRLLRRFGELTGTPVLLNTSFNNDAEPIVQTAADAIVCFLTTGLDYLVLGDFLVRKRAADSTALLDLAVGLRPTAALREVERARPRGGRTIEREVYFTYTGGAAAAVSPELFALLKESDGSRSLRQLGAAGGDEGEVLPAELRRLWEQRFVELRPR